MKSLKMKAAISEGFNQPLTIKEIQVKPLGKNDCLVKIHASGVCHTDLHAVSGDWPIKPKMPLIPGHEGVGEVVALGTNVTEVKIGDRVGIPWLYSACGNCEFCLTSRETICPKALYGGYNVDGGYAQYCVADARYVGHIPPNLSYEQAATIMCAGVTSYKALKRSKVKPGQWIAIFGIGGLGHLAIQYAKIMGMKIIAIDIDDNKLALAKKHNVEMTINSAKEDVANIIQTKIGGADGCIITSVAKKPFNQAFVATKNDGNMVCVGIPPEKLEFSIFDIVLRQINITGSLVGTRKDLDEALKLAADGKIKVNLTLAKLENINEIFDKMKTGKLIGRVVIKMT